MSGLVSASTVTDGTASLTGGNWVSVSGVVTASTFTDGAASLTAGTLSGAEVSVLSGSVTALLR